MTRPGSPFAYDFVDPPHWRVLERRGDGVAWRLKGGHSVIASCEVIDGKRWIHLSRSGRSRMPTWPELVEVRDALLGPEQEAYQVCPPASRYVNINPTVLHLWACLDEPAQLPQFEGDIDGVRSI